MEIRMRSLFVKLIAASAATALFGCAIDAEDENDESVLDPDHDTAVSSLVAGPRPPFQLPFPCGQQWRLDTWGHAPALDMVREPNQVGTEGALLIAPANGTVKQSFRHSNAGNMIQINHGGGWFTTYIHLQSRSVSVGQQVVQGQEIGRVGKDGATSNGHPHLHYELAIDANGDGLATWGAANTERVRPWFNGIEYGQSNGQTWRNVTSANCGSGGTSPTISPSDSAPNADFEHVSAGGSYSCPFGTLCTGVWDPSVGKWKVFKLYYCRTYALSNWLGAGFFWNNQTPGTTAFFYGQSGNVLASFLPGGQLNYNWDPVWFIKNC
jgi:murein DD-endopeptidase MepM/ murein hydrolase activator NlpD